MLKPFRPVTALLLAVAFLLTGSGLVGILLPVAADIAQFPAFAIGLLGTGYFGGLLVGCYWCPILVRRVGHIRSFTAFAAAAAATSLTFPLIKVPEVWIALRFVLGLSFAGLTMIIESWLNEKSDNETRGQVLGVYTVINLTVITLGQQLLNFGDPAGFSLYSVLAILICFAVIPVAITTSPSPAPVAEVRIRMRRLYRASPVAIVGCLGTGLALGAFWAQGPLFAKQAGMDTAGIAAFMSLTVLGGAATQWPLGRLSDRIDRRLVIMGGCIASLVGGLVMVFLGNASATLLMVTAFFFGGSSFVIYAICVAHANDGTGPGETLEISSGLLLSYALGAAIGPLFASGVVGIAGYGYLFAYIAFVFALVAGFTYYRIRQREALPPEDRDDFVTVPRSSPAVFNLDPRTPEEAADMAADRSADADPEALEETDPMPEDMDTETTTTGEAEAPVQEVLPPEPPKDRT